jgi:hypothetical protein
MARNLQPRSALTPPRSPAPINATRPDFPVRAGQFLGGTHPPDTDWPCVAVPLRGSSSPIGNSHSLCSAEADYDVDGDSARNPTQRIAVSSQSLLARAPDTITHREQRSDTASPCRNGHRRMHLRRSRRNGAPWPSADARIFSSSIAAAGGGTTTAKSNSSCACARPFG